MSKQIEITLKQAKELLVTTPSLKDVIYSNFPELKPSVVPNSFEGLGIIDGYYIDDSSQLTYSSESSDNSYNRNIFKTKQQAESSLAMAQLSQLMYATGDCNVDWNSEDSKYVIISNLGIMNTTRYQSFLAFNTAAIALEFRNKHADLIKQYYNY